MPSQLLYKTESDLDVLGQRFPCYSVHHATQFSTKIVSFFVFELFQKYSKDYIGPCHNNKGYCETKVCYSLCNHIVLMGHRGDS